ISSFIVVPRFCFCWFVCPFIEVLSEIRSEVTQKVEEGAVPTARRRVFPKVPATPSITAGSPTCHGSGANVQNRRKQRFLFYPSLEVLRHLRCLLLNKLSAARPSFDSLRASLVAPYLSTLSVKFVVNSLS